MMEVLPVQQHVRVRRWHGLLGEIEIDAAPRAEWWEWMLVVVASVVLMEHVQPVITIADQSALLAATLPKWADGYVSSLIGASIRAWEPDIVRADFLFRHLAGLFYLLAHQCLISRLVPRAWLRLTVMAAILLTPSPIIWLSSELLPAGALAMVLWAVVARASVMTTGLWLALYGLTKPDVLLPAVAVAGALTLPLADWRARLARGAAYLAWVPLLVAPCALVLGGSFFSASRGFVSFSQHYADLVRPHQLLPPPNPWDHHELYRHTLWPGARSLATAIGSDWRRYVDFVGLSVARSVENIIHAGLLPLMAATVLAWRQAVRPASARWVFLASITGVIPQVLLSFMHVRYTIRLRTSLLFLVGLGLAEAVRWRRRRVVAALVAGVVLTVAWSWREAMYAWSQGYWFYD